MSYCGSISYKCHLSLLLVIKRSWIQTIQEARISKKNSLGQTFLALKNWVLCIQSAGYNLRMVHNKFVTLEQRTWKFKFSMSSSKQLLGVQGIVSHKLCFLRTLSFIQQRLSFVLACFIYRTRAIIGRSWLEAALEY